jgi:hypothetical protein
VISISALVLDAGPETNWEECLFSLANSAFAGLEVIAAGRGPTLETAMAHAAALGLSVVRLEPEGGPLAQLRSALSLAHGTHVAVLGADAVVYPEHFARLAAAIGDSPLAWARTRVAATRPGTRFVETKRPHPLGDAPPLEAMRPLTTLYGLLLTQEALAQALASLPEDASLDRLLEKCVRPAPFVPAVASLERRLSLDSSEWLELCRPARTGSPLGQARRWLGWRLLAPRPRLRRTLRSWLGARS